MARAHEMLTVQSGDVKLAVYVSGSRRAPPLILVHGYPDSAAVWAPIRARLAKRYRVIAYDVRGAGASDAPGNNGKPAESPPAAVDAAERERVLDLFRTDD
ncbi:alpha/beta fold hydrolase [Serratia marcescens]|uniref:alpha/beta fold hydrolase n=1 Tax=Serratia marcescens TaxID=615 RepID=UPI000A76EC1E